MKKALFMLLCACTLTAATAAEAAKKPRRLTPAQEKATQFRAFERETTKAARMKKLKEWFLRKASGKKYTIPSNQGHFAADGVVGFRSGDFVFAVDSATGAPAYLSIKGSENLLDNAAAGYPFWEMETIVPGEEKPVWTGPYDGTFSYDFKLKNGIRLNWKTPQLRVSVTVVKDKDGAALFNITAKNLSAESRLNTLDFPKLALTVPGKAENVNVVIPWRRGRLKALPELKTIQHQEYPGSSARFQLTAFYDTESGAGRLFTAVDDAGFEKQFREIYLEEYGVLLHTLRRFPVNRGKAGNHVEKTFKCKLDVFKGDWYDAAKIYRQWWLQQKWAKRGPLYTNDVPDFLKKAPVFLRWYLRQSQGHTADKMEKMANAWTEFLPGRKLPGTLYHYSAFKEPPTRKNYPVSEYYGFCAEPFPGMVDALARMHAKGIRASVYLQSEIYNQFDSRNDALVPSLRLDMAGKPRLYVNERYMACRGTPVWRTRFLEMAEHVKNLGFTGIYMDTFGKTKINHECFDVRHGHSCGGGNIDCEASRTLGKDVRKAVYGGDRYIGGEACTEAFVDIMDYKLNAVHVYNGIIPLERAIYGDHLLSHGRIVRGRYDADECRAMMMDFTEGVIFGRFFAPPPKTAPERDLLKKLIAYTDLGYEYMRTGKMLRSLKFKDNSGIYKFTTEPGVHKNVRIPLWRNTVYQSYKDGSIGIAVAYFGTENAVNSLDFTGSAEWQMPPSAKVFKVAPDGSRTLLGTLAETKEISLNFSPLQVEFFVIEK